MAYEITGRVKSVSEVQQVTEKFAKRELVIEHGDKYPQLSKFESSGDRNDLLNDVREGDTVTISFDLRGREARDGRVWNTLSIWKLKRDESRPAPRAPTDGTAQDDIPF